jgi:peptide/nickel transport system permease protein
VGALGASTRAGRRAPANRGAFLARRLLQAVPTVLGVTLLVFLMIHLVPGDPARALLGVRATPRQIAELHHEWGLDRSLPAQYGTFLLRLAHGDLGRSVTLDTTVGSVVGQRLPVTGLLIAVAIVFTVLLTLPLATIAAVRRDTPIDAAVRSLPVIGLGMPPFWVGIMLILLFALTVRIFPVGGWGNGFAGHLRAAVLPALTIAIGITPITVRSLRASMIEVLGADFVATARAKGLSGSRVVRRHVLRNAAIPTLTVLAVNVGFLIGGTVVIEQVFAIPGLGQLMFNGISNRDFALVQGITLVFACAVVLVNLVTDLLYTVIDPRVGLG